VETFDVSAKVLNDKLLFHASTGRSAMCAKKVMVEEPACPEIEPVAVTARCVVNKFYVVLFVGILQLIVFSTVIVMSRRCPA
jgi:hypothetical protein